MMNKPSLTNSEPRYYGLDLVRSIAMLLGIVIHTSIYFMDDQVIWMRKEHFTDPLNQMVVEFIHLFRMQLFFLLAGFFAQMVINRKGLSPFLKDRFKRILIPFVFAVIIFTPLNDFAITCSGQASIMRRILMEQPFLDYLKNIVLYGFLIKTPHVDQIGFGSFWFIYYLILIYAAHVSLRWLMPPAIIPMLSGWLKNIIQRPFAAIWLGLLCFPIHHSLTEAVFFPNQLNFEWNNIGYHLVFYMFGVGLYNLRDSIENLQRNCFINLSLGAILVPFTMQLTPLVDSISPSVVHDLLNFKLIGFNWVSEAILEGGVLKMAVVLMRACAGWLFCLGFIGLAERFVRKSNPAVKYLSESSYWIFYVHGGLTASLSFLLANLDIFNSLTKAYIIVVSSFYMLFWSYNAFVRYTFLGDYFIGKRKARNQNKDNDHISTFAVIKSTWRPILIGFCAVYTIGAAFRAQGLIQGKQYLNEASLAQVPAVFNDIDKLDYVTDRFGRTSLHLAAESPEKMRDYNPVEKLLTHFTNVNPLDTMNRTPLFSASRMGHIKDVQILLKAGGDPNIADKYGHTPAHVAAIKVGLKDKAVSDNYFALLTVLKENGANINLKDHKGRDVAECLRIFGGRTIK